MWKTTTAHSTSGLSPKHQTSEISLETSDLMLKHQKWQHWQGRYTSIPDLKTWHLSTRYRAWQRDFQAWKAWQKFGAWPSRMTAFHWNHIGAWNLFSKKRLWIKTFISFFLAAPVPRVFSDVTGGLIQGKNLAERTHWSL